jgi:PAS domain S-box-containing protein
VDITELKKTKIELVEKQKESEDIFEGISDPAFLITLSQKFIKVNSIAYKKLGFTEKEMLKMGPADIESPESSTRFPEFANKTIKKGSFTFESEYMTKSGRIIPVEISSKLIIINNTPHYLAIARDISERKTAEKAILKK